ncbi:PepSY-associated TM helix domain-containing protein [Terriglobus sp. TAA 43]|uniref:PepSY-associated TM helix domain-containing protein n=1 Tax=Terriglobus sp. TAA 43 TaxID=278961 RepID=UPI001E310F42|nr:PepSY-associated TM helix domain-containing protein [Terriglobus sp. TAA 43]
MTTVNTSPSTKPESHHSTPGKAKQPFRVRLRKQTAIISRWLHIYLSMVSFAVVLFFAVTGLTLNHAEYFSHGEVVKNLNGSLSAKEMGPKDHPDTLAIVEHIRNTDHVHGAVNTEDLRVDDDQITFSFRGPGYSADTTVDRATGKYQVVETKAGFVAVINDLHKGRDSGKVWSWVIDGSAILLTLVSLSGLVLIFFIYKRRTSGLLLAAIATALCLLLYRIWVP